MSEPHDDEIVQKQLDTTRPEPSVEVTEIIASLDDVEVTQLGAAYNQIDHVLAHIFSNPPDAEAQVEVSFTYEGYRITVEQNGRARFVRVK